ncbi:uncharacterized protein M421DRAFT_396841 [Didymella exigua CBS 183.55]|uniref:Uncharacterized protein n=1 Tax=Didymella exigua CBS 183.55 TaxID=1150837 RepID=A0A6A5RG63_9PLEO|nr:uncharacterized protein M421DRAFT_396841 [Didymella exigua CBS 183.55]KAF1926463.1 hypothetical protein M421DRAFT_396841 [Didymella exigua CBS 183.55]
MLATPLSRLHISCSCAECNTFLRPLPKNLPPMRLSSDLLPPGLGVSLPPTPAATPIHTRKCTPYATPQLRPTAPTLAPSPEFPLTRSNSQKSSKEGAGGPISLPSLTLCSTMTKRVNIASRSLWTHISSPIDELKTPLSVKTPGLATCAQERCVGKVVPGFGRTVCGTCEDELRGAVLGLAAVVKNDVIEKEKDHGRLGLSRNDSLMAPSPKDESKHTEPELFAVPSTPPSTKLLTAHSRTHSHQCTSRHDGKATELTLFALPNTSLDKSFEEFTPTTPTTTYAQDFPAFPINSKIKDGKAASVKASKRSSQEVEGLARSLSKNGRKKESKTVSKIGSKSNIR